MKQHIENFKNREIEISEKGQLTINSKLIDYEYDGTSKKWSSRYLPYSEYNSLQELARAIADNTAEFVNTSD